MAGSPRKRAAITELEKRAREQSTPEEPMTALDVIHDFIAAGATMTALAEDVGAAVKLDIDPALITMFVNQTAKGRLMLLQARKLAAHAFAEQSVQILDEADPDKEELRKAEARSKSRQWLAGKWNREAYGETPQAISVTVNNGQEHLEALRHRQVQNATPKMLPPAEADFEVIDSPASTGAS